MKSLEDLIRGAIEEGRFDGLTLWRTSKGFQSNFKDKRTSGWRCMTGEDPIDAMRQSLGAPTSAPPPSEGSVFD